jgi:ElaB/YqjD/DUF883 family membrane-anchored ribosome-binding protein
MSDAKSKGNGMSSTISTDKLVEDLHAVVRDAEALLQATAAQTGDKIDGLRIRAKESLHQARVRLAEAEKEAVREVGEAAHATDQYVHRNPWQAVGIAAGVGLVIGLLIGRR